MGNYRFKFSDMLPNAWFYKLNHTSASKTRKLQNLTRKSLNKKVQSKMKSSPFASSFTPTAAQQTCQSRKSYHFNRDFKSTSHLSEPPRKSSNRRRCTKKTVASQKLIHNYSESKEYSNCHVRHGSIYSKVNHAFELVQNYSTGSSSCDDPVFYDLDSEFRRVKVDSPSNHYDYKLDLVSQLELKPIITKPDKVDHGIKPAVKFQGSSRKFEEKSSCSLNKDSIGEEKKCPLRKLRVKSIGVKLRAKSPRIASKRLAQVKGQESVSSHSRLMSVAIVQESIDPDRDFKESMMEMIMEHNMSTKEEFQQLLACYLSLNPGTYRELIVNVFEQILYEITGNQVLVPK
ncbi:transcription repressor OFP1-like [Apium graveolens]|uniref:transcription repressor OFP1-like n=1 Tax=Apium graveolens TaxID=4045 RepID=UPI003D79A330